jgi:signal transduction histidine kinase
MKEQVLKDAGDLEEILPYVDKLSHSRDEYIRSLEIALQLVQREVENLRQRRPVSQLLKENPDYVPVSQDAAFLQVYTSADEIIQGLHEHIAERFNIAESNIFLLVAPLRLHPAGNIHEFSILQDSITQLEEGGIIDWTLEERRAVIVPNLHESTLAFQSNVILIPLFLRGARYGIFAGFTAESEASFKNEDIAALTSLVESAAVALDNIRSSEEISRMNQRLAQLSNQMVQSSKLASIGELAGNIAHEINNPLQILLAHLQLLESGVGDPARRVEVIKQQIFRISDITRRLLDFARSAPGDATPAPITLSSLIDEVLLFVGSQLQRDGIRVEKECEDPSPVIAGIKTQIEQVLLNIIINARDAMPDGGLLTIGAFATSDHQALITIADTGTGITEEHLPFIFDSFYTTKPVGKGTGLGLSVTQNIIQQHHGKIELVSQPRKGTTFKITLPLFKEVSKNSLHAMTLE